MSNEIGIAIFYFVLATIFIRKPKIQVFIPRVSVAATALIIIATSDENVQSESRCCQLLSLRVICCELLTMCITFIIPPGGDSNRKDLFRLIEISA